MKTNNVLFKEKSTQHRIKVNAILFVRSTGHYCRMYVGQSIFNFNNSLQTLLEDPQFENLVQVHRCYAVNINQVSAINRTELFIENIRLLISRSFQQKVQAAFDNTPDRWQFPNCSNG